ncbi:hypothetical protein [Flagellimonas sp. S3867]|uniref:hypothetical protein n=1 Tax=Flagellimonas sp. S3867 TaxID=2768063 RepID=UPI001686C5DF|nr:hypothetical protein [Flagellimonas sp. S3867]
MRSKKHIQKKLIIEGLITLFIALSPVLTYSYKYTSNDTEVLDLIFFEVTSNGFADARTALWYYLQKIVPLILLIIWFVTNKQWWYHAILIPIAMFSFQLYSAIATDSNVDENEILYVIAVTMVIVPIVYFIRVKLFDKHVHGIDLDAMDTELQILKEKEELRKEREKLEKRQKTVAKKM